MSRLGQEILFLIGYLALGAGYTFIGQSGPAYARQLAKLQETVSWRFEPEESEKLFHHITLVLGLAMWPFILLFDLGTYILYCVRWYAAVVREIPNLYAYSGSLALRSDRVRGILLYVFTATFRALIIGRPKTVLRHLHWARVIDRLGSSPFLCMNTVNLRRFWLEAQPSWSRRIVRRMRIELRTRLFGRSVCFYCGQPTTAVELRFEREDGSSVVYKAMCARDACFEKATEKEDHIVVVRSEAA